MKQTTNIAYLSMEIAISEKLANYAGGLGILAGDFLRSAADLNLPLVGVTLLNKEGYFKQKISRQGQQLEIPELNKLNQLKKLALTIKVNIGPDQVLVDVWQYLVNNRLPVYFLDTDIPDNKKAYRQLTNHLYGQNSLYRLKQEIILGRGGVKVLKALGYKIKKYHINEGHGMLSALELLTEMKWKTESEQRSQLRRQLIFTNHTPVPGGQDIFSLNTVLKYQPDFPVNFSDLVINQTINLTRLGVSLAGQVNVVSKRHQKTLTSIFPQTKINYITNGVHAATWTAPEFVKLYNQYIPGWQTHNNFLKRASQITLSALDKAHQAAKKRMLKYVAQTTGTVLDHRIFTLVFARRFTAYKQPLLLLTDINRLLEINRTKPLQIIYAGKAHPQDQAGKAMIKKIYTIQKKYQKMIKIVFLENYNITLAKLLTAGADLWLNNPLPPNEACGTSGMKAALNGVPQLSSPDGWWLEAYRPGKNGWIIENSQADDLYQILETKILPLYYQKPLEWQKLMRNAISYNAPIYNSERMVKEYQRRSYS